MQQETVQQTGIQSSNQPFVASQGQVSQGQPIMTAPLAGQPVIAGPSSDQPIMYQMPPGQLQPVSSGTPTVSAQGQPGVQYYISAGGQLVQHVPQVQPIPQIVHPIPGQGIPNNLAQHHDPEMAPIRFNKAYMKSALGVSRVLEFVSLLTAGGCIIVYSNRTFGLDGRANFFRGITIFSWVMVIIYHFIYVFGLNKNKTCFGQPSNFTLMSLSFQIFLTILLISCTASLTVRAKNLTHWFDSDYDDSIYFKEIVTRNRLNTYIVFTALAFGYISCLCFLDDIRLLFVMFRKERAQEAGGGIVQGAQQPFTGQVAYQGGTVHQQQFETIAQPTFPPQVTPQAEQKGAEGTQP